MKELRKEIYRVKHPDRITFGDPYYFEQFHGDKLCCQNIGIITDFSKLKEAGQDYVATNVGPIPPESVKGEDGEAILKSLIAEGKGRITQYGVVFDGGLQVERIYQGGNLPAVANQVIMAEAVLTPTTAPQDREELLLLLPMPEKRLERMLDRAGFETKTVSGYVLNTTPQTITVTGGSFAQTVTMTSAAASPAAVVSSGDGSAANQLTFYDSAIGKLELIKVDAANRSKRLANATFEIRGILFMRFATAESPFAAGNSPSGSRTVTTSSAS